MSPLTAHVRTPPGLGTVVALASALARDRTPYPAVLFIHGLNDPRVDVWHSAKAAARLQAATSSGKPIPAAPRRAGRTWRRQHGAAGLQQAGGHLQLPALAVRQGGRTAL